MDYIVRTCFRKKKIRGKRKTVEEKKRKGEERGVEKEH